MNTADAYATNMNDCRNHLESLTRLLTQHEAGTDSDPTLDRVVKLDEVEALLRDARNLLGH